jgi:RNA polymerase II subunit A small phosphatase-like protein
LKKLKRLRFDLHQPQIVDDSPSKVSRNDGNASYFIPIEASDYALDLILLKGLIHSLLPNPSFCNVEKRGWRRRFQNKSNGQIHIIHP